jgi:hypothetical protein
VLLLDGDELVTYQDAMGKFRFQVMARGSGIWLKFMDKNQVWNLLYLHDGANAFEYKYVYKKKTNIDENISICRARLVTNGFSQVQGFDYRETSQLMMCLS